MTRARRDLFQSFLLEEHTELSRPSRFGINLLRLIYFTFSEFRRDRAIARALELAYTTLFTLVPLTALFLFVSRGIGSLERWIDDGRKFIINLTIGVLPEADQQAINDFLDRAFTSIYDSLEGPDFLASLTSLMVLAVFSISLLLSIENMFNEIFGVRRRRTLFAKVTVFWLILTAAPIFLGGSMYMRSAIASMLEQQSLLGSSFSQWALAVLFPFVFSTAAFFILYWKVPFTSVRIGPALLGAFSASGLWEVAKSILAWYVVTNVTYKNVYGTLGTIPVFLLFLYVTWLIIILGAEIAYAGHHFNQLHKREILRHLGQPVTPVYLAVKLGAMLAERFRQGHGPATADELAGTLELEVAPIEGMLEVLEREGLVVAVEEPTGAFQLARAPAAIPLETIVRAAGALEPIPPEDGRVSELLTEMQRASVGAVQAVSVADLIRVPVAASPAGGKARVVKLDPGSTAS